MHTVNVLVVTSALNRKTGANGSMLDLIDTLRQTRSSVSCITTARPLFVDFFEGLWFYKPNDLFKLLHFDGRTIFDVVFCIASEDFALWRARYPSARIISFQTSNIPTESKSLLDYLSRISVLDDLIFQTPSQYREGRDLQTVNAESLPKMWQVFPTVSDAALKVAIPNTVARSPGESIQFGFFGSIQERKNVNLLIRAFMTLIAEGLPVSLNICGPIHYSNQEYASEFLSLIRSCRCNGRITYHGHVRSHYSVMLKQDIIILPSHEEGFSTTIREAMCFGKALCLSSIPSWTGWLTPGVDALFFDPDSEEQVRDAVRQLVKDEQQRKALAQRSRHLYERHLTRGKMALYLQEILGI